MILLFLAALVAIGYLIYQNYKLREDLKLQALFGSLLFIAASNNSDSISSLRNYIDLLAYKLPHQKYDVIMTHLCSSFGLVYAQNAETGLIDEATADELAIRMHQNMATIEASVIKSIQNATTEPSGSQPV